MQASLPLHALGSRGSREAVIHSEVEGTTQARMEDWAPFTLPRLLPKPFVP